MTQGVRTTEKRIEGATGLNLFVRSWRPAGTVYALQFISACATRCLDFYSAAQLEIFRLP